MRNIVSRNPFTGQVRAPIPFITDKELHDKMERAASAFEVQKKRSLEERASMIKKLGQIIDHRKKEISEAITWEMGKPIADAEG